MNNRILLIPLMGLMIILSTSCTKESTDDIVTYSIGQYYGGGIIFYIDDTEQHGFICAPADQSEGVPWSNGGDIITYATGEGMGTGVTNTEIIVAAQGEGNYAAKICSDLELNGYDDWFLPSKSECFSMYFNLDIYRGMGDFADELYWSSTEASIGNVYSQYSNDGYPPNGGYYKSESHRVRAVRAF